MIRKPTILRAYSTLSNKWEFEQMGFCSKTNLQVFREQMGIRTNGNLKSENTHSDTKWEVFCSFKSCCFFSFGLTTLLALKIHNVFSQLKTTYFQGWLISFPKSVQRCLLHCVCCSLPSDAPFSPTFNIFYHNPNSINY